MALGPSSSFATHTGFRVARLVEIGCDPYHGTGAVLEPYPRGLTKRAESAASR